MKSDLTKFAQMAVIMLALIAFSCSGDNDDNNNNGGSSSPSSSPSGGGSSSSGTGGGNFNYGSLPYQGKTYKTIKIGDQTWMAENLNYDVPSNDTDVCYDNAPANCTTYGRLYDWETAMSACPSGWRLPTRDDWENLVDLAGGISSDAAAAKLKAESGWSSSKSNGTNDYGFSALPGGEGSYAYPSYNFNNLSNSGNWWSSQEMSNTRAMSWYINASGKIDDQNWVKDDKLFSVRCVKN